MAAITAAVNELAARSIRVLSPADPRVVAAQGDFLFVASDRVRSVRLVQDRHLESIRAANFLWLVCPDGYLGRSASMEVGFAAAVQVPIFTTHVPGDLTLREYVTVVPTIAAALRQVQASTLPPRRQEGILINPHASVQEAHDILERVGRALTRQNYSGDLPHRDLADLRTKIALPTRVQ
jgi:hypothetical protein